MYINVPKYPADGVCVVVSMLVGQHWLQQFAQQTVHLSSPHTRTDTCSHSSSIYMHTPNVPINSAKRPSHSYNIPVFNTSSFVHIHNLSCDNTIHTTTYPVTPSENDSLHTQKQDQFCSHAHNNAVQENLTNQHFQ